MTQIDEFIWKKVIKTGTSEIPNENNRVKIHLNAFFEMAKEPFDSSYLRGKPIVRFYKTFNRKLTYLIFVSRFFNSIKA